MGLQTDAARVGDRKPVANLLPETRKAARESTAKVEGRCSLARMQRFHRDGIKLSDTGAARLLVAVESSPTRDRLWLDQNRGRPLLLDRTDDGNGDLPDHVERHVVRSKGGTDAGTSTPTCGDPH